MQFAIRWRPDVAFAALILSAAYPATLVLSSNWYAANVTQIAVAMLVPIGVSASVYLVLRALWRIIGRPWPAFGLGGARGIVARICVGIVCSLLLSFFLYGALKEFSPQAPVLLAMMGTIAAVITGIAAAGYLRYYVILLALMTGLAAINWAVSVSQASFDVRQEERRSVEEAPFGKIHFNRKPNIYLIIYDGYGNSRLHRDVFAFDNSKTYEELQKRGFRRIDTFSNYWSTWSSMLGVFMARHHHYRLDFGVKDSRIGRGIMNGSFANPVHAVLRNNDYRIQYIEPQPYLVKQRGQLDFVYPDETAQPLYAGLRLFKNPLLDIHPAPVAAPPQQMLDFVEQESAVLFSRLQQMTTGTQPWFTYIHFPLPAHAMGDWRKLKPFEEVYRTRTKQANVHMMSLVDRLTRADPTALIILMGDHGSYRYDQAYRDDPDPSESFLKNGIPVQTATLDYFGILLAIRSNKAECDAYVYNTMTPVNLMRGVFACLADDAALLARRAPDDAYFPKPLHQTVKNGVMLERWLKVQPPN